MNVVVIVVDIGVVFVVAAVDILALGGSGVATIIIGTNFLFFCSVFFQVGLSPSEKQLVYLLHRKPVKNDKKMLFISS